MKEKLNYDHFYSQSSQSIAQGAFAILHNLQGMPEYLVASSAMFFLLICERYQVVPRKALDAAGRMLHDAAYRDTGGHYEAVRRCLEDEAMTEGGWRDD